MELKPVTQRALEAYQEYLVVQAREAQSAARINRLMIEAAGKAGFAVDLPPDLLDVAPRVIAELSQRIAAHVREALELPGE